YLEASTWWSEGPGKELPADFRIAYFSAEFGITECLPIYSGGLGILAGDHLKAASDLGLPLVGVGFLYQRGYFRQTLNADGWQVEHYPGTDFHSLPIEPTDAVVEVEFPGRMVHARIWKARVGRVVLLLLDTNLPENSEPDRHIAGNLYGGDNETRIQQEMVLGIGGIRALDATGLRPEVCHLNEGHSAFLSLERIRHYVQEHGLSFEVSANAAAAGHLFTTHTPVPAGFDLFPRELMEKYFAEFAPRLGISFEDLFERGRHPHGEPDKFNMAVLAFRHARQINGVSRLHGAVSREMAHSVWADFPIDEVPVGHVTNGIHTDSFLSHEMADLLDAHGARTDWSKVDAIPDADLWAVRTLRRRKLVEWARAHLERRRRARGAAVWEIDDARRCLDPDALTIGFARRFATYKRGDLLLRDVERIKRLIGGDRPVQFVFAGKAHPRDDAGKQLIQHIVRFAGEADVRGRIVFLEDYDMTMARYLVQGVDVWLNNPRRPMEASGTSGMKVVPNGGLNFSVLDGWWAEAFTPEVGWAIGDGTEYGDPGYQDHVEAIAVYETLEREIIPLFHDRGPDGIPHAWIRRVKASMRILAPIYSTNRMVREYAEKYYVPAAHRTLAMCADDFQRTRSLVAWKHRVREAWGAVRVEDVSIHDDTLEAGQAVPVVAKVHLGGSLAPEDVRVEIRVGPVDSDRNLLEAERIRLRPAGALGEGRWEFHGDLPTHRSGQQGFSVRVLPTHPDAVLPQELPLIRWEG
ncbi:MAG: alpha-glucan family phosphorylase, partial [Armatimonadota bacterium]